MKLSNWPALIALATVLFMSPPLRANHGPGTSGGGSSTSSGETLKEGAFDFSVREDYTEFESISRQEAEARGLRDGDFDALSRSFVTSFNLTYGVTNDFQLGGQIGYYA